jgi:methionyl-tRNA synthetase
LLAAGYDVPKQLFVHGYLQLDDRKISKSLGNVIDPLDLLDVYGSDAVRFWAVRAVSFGQDGNVSIESLHDRYERELGNDLGNLLSRTTAMIAKYRAGRLPMQDAASEDLAREIAGVRDEVAGDLDRFDVTGALERIWSLVRWLNRYVTERKPWEIAKDDARAGELDRVLYDLAEGLRVLAVVLWPYLPETAPRILEALQPPVDPAWENVEYGRLVPAEGVEAAAPLFPRIEAPAAAGA